VGQTNRPPEMKIYKTVYKYILKNKTKSIITTSDNQPLEFSLEASDPDGHDLTYSAVNLPDGASLNQTSGNFTWTPVYTNIGSLEITFTATDTGTPAQSDSAAVTIIISEEDAVNTENDRDGDHVSDIDDAFPDNPDEWEDTDHDGQGNVSDSDDDNDGMSDEWEIEHGLDPLYDDSEDDPDNDGKTNGEEYEENTDPSENSKASRYMIKNIINNSTENGGVAQYYIRLLQKPIASTSINIQSMDLTEGIVSPNTLTFTPDNWKATSHIITITGVDDQIADGSQPYKIKIFRNLLNGQGLVAAETEEITILNIDNDSPGITVSELNGTLSESGDTGILDVHLNYKPESDVTLIVNTDSSEASLSPATLVFTPENWNTVQSITITGVDDSQEDGNRQFDITFSAESDDSGYHGIDVDKVKAINIDNDTPGLTITGPEWNTREDSDTTTFTAKLNKEPSGDVIFRVASDNTQEGIVSESTITFTTENWNHEKTITVTGSDDDIIDGDQEYTVSLTVDTDATVDTSGYTLLESKTVTLTNEDDDVSGNTSGNGSNISLNDDDSSSAGGGCFIGSLSFF